MMETNSNNQTIAISPNDKMASVKNKIDKLDLDREWLEKKIDIDKADLDKSISIINTTCPIKRNEYWISLFNSTDVDGTFTAIYEDIIALKNATVNAFQSSFFTSKETLKLLKKLADYELDLYSIIDESELTSAELSSLFVSALKDTNVKDETVLQLLQQAKDRALRLKERFESFRNEFENKLKDSSSKANNRIGKLESETKESINNLNKRIGDQGVSIHNLKEGLKKISTMSDDKNKSTKTWVVLGSVLTFVFSLVGSFLIHHFL